MEKIQSTTVTMKMGYCLIASPFKSNASYLNSNLDYKPPDHKSVTLFGTLAGAARNSTWELKLSVPVDNSGAGGFNYTLKVANVFDDIIIFNKLYIILVEQLFSTYKNHALCNTEFHTFWTQATHELKDLKNDDRTYKSNAFHRICNTFLTRLPSLDALLLLATVFSITCLVERKNQ